MKKFIGIIIVSVICIVMFIGCISKPFTKLVDEIIREEVEARVIEEMYITNMGFDTYDDCKWYMENIWTNNEINDVVKDNIYFEMTGKSIYPKG